MALLACPVVALADPVYSMTFLPSGFNATAMNSSGRIVGNTSEGVSVWDGASLINLGLGANSYGYAINGRGDVAGALGSWGYGQPFLYTSEAMHHVGPVLDDVQAGRANGLNDLGQVAGEYATFGGDQHAWVDAHGTITMLGTLSGRVTWAAATAINNRGQIVGGSTYVGADSIYAGHAFLYQDGRMQDLGTLGGEESFATDINDMGQVVGWSYDETGDTVPFLYTGGSMRSLGPLDRYNYVKGEAWAINNAGMVVGWSQLWADERTAFLYMDGKMTDLNQFVEGTDGWQVVEAYDINDAQQILGKACRDGECMSVRLDLVSAVPEPGNYALLTAGLVLLAGWRKTGKRESLRFS
ncbi:DUF3466 family protein [Massilia sp. BSC265]|uniref:DUF3466 family protein n=1 Tax=Massilia sp. BSC265 TaxID=1549812 RepID=UPI00068A38C2|nr:DUF3466 family protein [Massilia sp. BSC265]